jgi:multiple antibiotic resistance protein
MLNAKPAEVQPDNVSDAANKADLGASIAVVPLTIPLLTGPATISTMVIYAEKTRHWWELAVLVGYGVVVGLVTYLVFSASGKISRALGQTGINIMTRLMGLILAALAVELLADGLIKLFPVLGSHLIR